MNNMKNITEVLEKFDEKFRDDGCPAICDGALLGSANDIKQFIRQEMEGMLEEVVLEEQVISGQESAVVEVGKSWWNDCREEVQAKIKKLKE